MRFWNRRKNKRYKWACYWNNKGHVKKGVVEECAAVLDVNALARTGFQGCDGIELQREGDNLTIISQGQESLTIPLVQTFPHFGGIRWWFTCPKCGRRVGKLYLPAGESFACRHCHDLTYRLCQEHKCEGEGGMFVRLFRSIKGLN